MMNIDMQKNIETRVESIKKNLTWDLGRFDARKQFFSGFAMEFRNIAMESFEHEINHKYGNPLDLEISIIEEETQAYGSHLSKHVVVLVMLATFSHDKWVGPKEGVQVVYTKTIPSTVPKYGDEFYNELELGRIYVNMLVPDAVFRIGCTCCYGNGPGASECIVTKSDGSVAVTYTVNFDFELDER